MKTSVLLAFVLSFVIIVSNCSGLNILGIFPYQGLSHFLVYKVYLHELVNKGHNVTVISHFPEKDPPKNYHDISLAGSIKIFAGDMPMEYSYITMFNLIKFLLNTGALNCKVMLENKEVQNLIKRKPKFDVVVMEQFNTDCGLGIAYHLGAPVVASDSSVMMPWHYQRHGVPYNPSYGPVHFLEGGTKPTLYQRVERTIVHFLCRILYYFVTQRVDQKTLAKYIADVPPLEDLARDIKFLLMYHNFVLTGSRLFPANIIEVGGYHVPQAKPLTGDLKKFVEEAEHGVVYISFGSVIKSSTLPKDKQEAVLDAMKAFPQRFIWKWEDKTLLIDKNKLYIQDWLPQVDILGHKNTLAFFCHGGLGGTTEALHYAVPTIAMPIFGDQPSNAAVIEESGLGIHLHFRDLTKENLIAAFKKVLNPEFRASVKKVSDAWHDRPMSPLDTAVYWTEFAARHSNFTYRTAAADVPFYQYNNLDVFGIFLFATILIYVVLKTAISLRCSKKTNLVKVLKRE